MEARIKNARKTLPHILLLAAVQVMQCAAHMKFTSGIISLTEKFKASFYAFDDYAYAEDIGFKLKGLHFWTCYVYAVERLLLIFLEKLPLTVRESRSKQNALRILMWYKHKDSFYTRFFLKVSSFVRNQVNMTILALAPHPDDLELSCGGALNKLINQGNTVYYVVFSPCDKSLPEGFEEGALYREVEDAAACIGISKSHIIKYDFPVREFPKHRQDILENLVKLNRELNPDLVFIPNSNDLHQDHKTIYEEGMRAFKRKKILGYELLWNNDNFKSNFFIKLQREHIDIKKEALKAFKSQSFRGYFSDEFLFGLARVRGVQCGSEYAEAFELIRWDI